MDPNNHMEEETCAHVLLPVLGRVILQTCLVCGELVSSGLVLERHMRALHLLHKPYDCKKCGAIFNNRRELGSHQANLHQHKKVTCKHCPYSAISKAQMCLHVCVHTRGIKCSKCDKKFLSLSVKLAHEKLHHGARTTYVFEHCDRSYVTLTAHCIHVCGKHGNGYLCGHCGKQFDTPIQQKRHQSKCSSE